MVCKAYIVYGQRWNEAAVHLGILNSVFELVHWTCVWIFFAKRMSQSNKENFWLGELALEVVWLQRTWQRHHAINPFRSAELKMIMRWVNEDASWRYSYMTRTKCGNKACFNIDEGYLVLNTIIAIIKGNQSVNVPVITKDPMANMLIIQIITEIEQKFSASISNISTRPIKLHINTYQYNKIYNS